MTDGWQRKIVQGVFDQFAPLKDLDEVAYTQARLSKGADGAVEGVFRFGPPKLTDGALDIKRDGKGFVGVLQGLNGEHDLFLAWVAGKRAAYLATQGREHLFTPDEITSLNGLANGTMADGRDRAKVYAEAQRTLRRYNDAVLDVAQEAGLLNADNRKQWAEDYYIPFFRAAEAKGGHAGSAFDSLVRQQVIERLKGGGDPLGIYSRTCSATGPTCSPPACATWRPRGRWMQRSTWARPRSPRRATRARYGRCARASRPTTRSPSRCYSMP